MSPDKQEENLSTQGLGHLAPQADADSGLIFARGGHASVEAIICRDATGALSPELPIDDGNPAPAVIGNPYRDESVEKSEKSPTY